MNKTKSKVDKKQLTNIPQVKTFAARTGTFVQVDLETRVRQLEERLAKLEAIIKINGNRVDIKTLGKMSIKASSIDLDAGGSVKIENKRVAFKGDRVSGTCDSRNRPLINGRIE